MSNKHSSRVRRTPALSFGKRAGVTTTVFAVVVIVVIVVAAAATYFATAHVLATTTTTVSTAVTTSGATVVSTLPTTVVSTSGTTVISTVTDTTTPATHTILDQAGYYVTLPVNVTRVADVSGVSTYAIVALGAQKDLVTTELDLFSGVQLQWMNLIMPGLYGTGTNAWNTSSYSINVEVLATLNPQVVITSERFGVSENNPTIAALGIPQVDLNWFGNASAVEQNMLILGQVLGPAALARAQEWNSFVNYNLNYINSTLKANNVNPPTAAEIYFSSSSTEVTYNSEEQAAAFLPEAGAVNAADSICSATQIVCDINDEELLALNPPIIFLGSGGTYQNLTELQNDPLLSQLSAVKSGQVYLDPSGLATWSGTSPEAILMPIFAAWKLYPTLFPESYFLNQTEYFYKTFYNFNLNQTLINDMLAGGEADGISP